MDHSSGSSWAEARARARGFALGLDLGTTIATDSPHPVRAIHLQARRACHLMDEGTAPLLLTEESPATCSKRGSLT